MRNAKIIEDSFDQIKESTGITSIEEIVTTFIKAEEQNSSLLNFLNLLSQETDGLEENNVKLDSNIAKYKVNFQINNIFRVWKFYLNRKSIKRWRRYSRSLTH